MSTPELKSCCVSGSIHSGTPSGSIETVHGLRTYIASPEGGSKEKTVIWLPDVFGIDLVNTQLVCDEWAKNGYYVLLPDIMGGSPIPAENMNAIIPNLRVKASQSILEKAADGAKAAASYGPWAIAHRDVVTRPIVEPFLQAVKAEGSARKLIAVGTCFGGRHVILSGAKDSVFDAIVSYHPAGLTLPDDLTALTVPTIIIVGDEDDMMPVKQVEEAQAIFKEASEKNGSKGVEVKVIPKAVHGFSVRGDQTVPEEKEHKEVGFKAAVDFLNRIL